MKINNYKNKQIRNYIRDFNFPNPNWENLPDGFFLTDKKSLNIEERHLHSAILTAWFIDQSGELKQQIIERSVQNPIISRLYLAGKIVLLFLFFILLTGNLINYFLIEVYHSIL